MTETQKIIKYFAIAIAIVLIINIFYLFFNFVNFFFDFETTNDSYQTTNYSSNINNMMIDLKYSQLEIKNSSDSKIETNNDDVNITVTDNKLTITENKKIWKNAHKDKNKVIVYLPEEKQLEEVNITAGAGNIKIAEIKANVLKMELGASKATISSLDIKRKALINCGVGKFNIKSGIINSLDLNMGVGEVTIKALLLGKNNIDTAIGDLNLNLLNGIDNYKLKISKGLGDVTVNNLKIKNDYYVGNGDTSLEIEGAISSIDIKTKE